MKLLQFYKNSHLCLGTIEDGIIVELDFAGTAIDFIVEGEAGYNFPTQTIDPDQLIFAPPLHNPSKIIAIGLNYKDHAEESGGKIPEDPLVFAKFPNSLLGNGDQIKWNDQITQKVDYEAELAVVIGKKIKNCPKERAMDSVFGYCCANDISARDLQFGDGQWVRGKSLDTFCPLGPWIVTRDEIPDPNALRIRCWLNDSLMQDSHTSSMIFHVPDLVSYLSNHFTLFPGDIILTGTPAGVGTFRKPSLYLKDGDRVVVEIEGLGRLENTCRAMSS